MKGTCRSSDVIHQLGSRCDNQKPTGEATNNERRATLEKLRDFGSWSDHEYAVRELAKLDAEAKSFLGVTDLAAQFRRDLNSQGQKVKSLLKEKLENPARDELNRLREQRNRDKQAYDVAAKGWRRQVEELQTEINDLRQYTGLQSGVVEPIAPAFPNGSTPLKQALQFAAETIAPRTTNGKFLMLFASTWSEQVQPDGRPFSLYGLYWWALLNLADALSSPSVVPEYKRAMALIHGNTLRQWGNYMKARTRWELSLGPARFLPGQNQSV